MSFSNVILSNVIMVIFVVSSPRTYVVCLCPIWFTMRSYKIINTTTLTSQVGGKRLVFSSRILVIFNDGNTKTKLPVYFILKHLPCAPIVTQLHRQSSHESQAEHVNRIWSCM